MSSLNTLKPEILKSQLLLRDVESEMKKEFDRRKKLRLQQVRQQSKDLAYTLREKVRLEKSHQRNLCKNKKQKHLSQWQEDKLNDLQSIYQNCLEDVGQSHVQAAEQPDIESICLAEQKRNLAKAASRGLEARQKKQIMDDENKQRHEAPLIQKQLARTKEDIRSIFISSLSPPTSYSKLSSEQLQHKTNGISHITEPQRKTEQHPKVTVLQEIPTNIQLETVGAKRSVQIDKASDRPTNCKGISTRNNPYTCTDCGFACCCHRGSTKRNLRRCFSESRLASDSESEYDSDSTWPPRTSPRSQQSDYSRRVTSAIKCYDFTNNFRKKYKKPFLVTRHGQGDSDIRSIQQVQSEIDLAQKKSKKLKEMADKERHRGRLAVYKEKIARDFDNLRKELETLNREESRAKSMTRRMQPRPQTGVGYQPREDFMQRSLRGDLLNTTPNMVTIEQTTSTISSEEPNVVNVTRRHYSSPVSPLQTSLQEVLDRIEERRNVLLQQNSPSSEKDPVYKVSSEEKYRFTTPIYGDRPDFGTKTRMYTDKVKKVDVRVKSPRDITPTVDVEVKESSIGLDVKGLDQKEKDTSSSFDGVTVTIRVKKNPLDRMKSPKLFYGNDSSTSYNSPPDTITPSKKNIVDSLVEDLEVKGSSRDYLLPHINKLLTMSRESIEEMGGTLNQTHTISVQPAGQDRARPMTLNQTHTVSFQPAGEDRTRPTTLYETSSATFQPGSDVSGYEANKSQVENLKTMYDTLTGKYLQKLFEMSRSFKDLLKDETSEYGHPHTGLSPIQVGDGGRRKLDLDASLMDALDMAGWNWEQAVVSAESSYFNLPSKVKHNVFPIHQKTVANEFKKYPKADQTFQELADILVRQEISMDSLPDGLYPLPPSFTLPISGDFSSSSYFNSSDFLSSMEAQRRPPLPRQDMTFPTVQDRLDNMTFPIVPDIQAKFDFINPNLLPSPDPNDPNDTSGSIDIFQGINIADYNLNPAPGNVAYGSRGNSSNDQQVYSTIRTETVNSEIKFDTPVQQKFALDQEYNVSSPNEMETELQKMGLGWAGANLRKTRKAAELSAGSSSGMNRSSSLPRKLPSNIVKLRDRPLRPRQNPRSSSPINPGLLPPYKFSTSTDSVESGVGHYSKKKTTKRTITSVRSPLRSGLSPPNLSLRTPAIRSPNTSARSMNSRR